MLKKNGILNLQDKFTEAEYYITDGVHPHVAVATLIADE